MGKADTTPKQHKQSATEPTLDGSLRGDDAAIVSGTAFAYDYFPLYGHIKPLQHPLEAPAHSCGGPPGDLATSELPADCVVVHVEKTPEDITAERQRCLSACCCERRCRWVFASLVSTLLVACVFTFVIVAHVDSSAWASPWGDGALGPSDGEDLPPLCADSLADLKSEWACTGNTGPDSRAYQLTTGPSLYYDCQLTPQQAIVVNSPEELTTVQKGLWAMQCKVDCFVVDLAAEQEQRAVSSEATEITSASATASWTAPEWLKQACAARADKSARGTIMDYLSFELPASPPSDDALALSQALLTNVTYVSETGLALDDPKALGLFEFAQDSVAHCEVRTGWDSCLTLD